MFPLYIFLDYLCWISSYYYILFIERFCNNCPCSDNGSFRQNHIFGNQHAMSNPHLISNDNVLCKVDPITLHIQNGVRISSPKDNLRWEKTLLTNSNLCPLCYCEMDLPQRLLFSLMNILLLLSSMQKSPSIICTFSAISITLLSPLMLILQFFSTLPANFYHIITSIRNYMAMKEYAM